MGNLIPVNEIHSLWKEITSYLKEVVNPNFRFFFEGEARPLMGKITINDDRKSISSAKRALQEIGVPMQKISQKHGAGKNFTILVLIGNLKKTEIGEILEKISKRKSIHVSPAAINIPENTPTSIIPETQNHEHNCLTSFTRVINNVFTSIGEIIKFEYEETGKVDGFCLIKTENQKSAEKISLILRWILGSETHATVEDSTVMVDCKNYKGKPKGIAFCFSPDPSSITEAKLEEKLLKICFGSKPIITTKAPGIFSVTYTKKALMLQKMYDNLKLMDWPVKLNDDHIEINFSTEEKITELPSNNMVSEENIPQPNSNFSPEEIELREMVLDENVRSRLNPETIRKIDHYFLEKKKRDNPDWYANELLKKLQP